MNYYCHRQASPSAPESDPLIHNEASPLLTIPCKDMPPQSSPPHFVPLFNFPHNIITTTTATTAITIIVDVRM